MTRRLSFRPTLTRTVTLAASLALACLAGRPALGSTLLNFRLSNEGRSPISKVDFKVLPPGAVVPPVVGTDPETGRDLTGSPLTILPTSSGFDPSRFSVALGSGPGVQGVRLLFGQTQTVGADGKVTYAPALDESGEPIGLFMPGAVLNFALNVDTSDPAGVQLLLPTGAAGLSLKAFVPEVPVVKPDDPPGDNAGGSQGGQVDPPANQVPEPGSMVLWSALAALALVRVRSYRRAHARATEA